MTFDGNEYKPYQSDTTGLSVYQGGTFLSFSISDIIFFDTIPAITVAMMKEIFTLMANGIVQVNGEPVALPLTKTYSTPESPINGKVTVQQNGQALVLQSNIHQLTVEFSTDGSNDVSVSLCVYWETLVSGKCVSFNNGGITDFTDFGTSVTLLLTTADMTVSDVTIR
ncbi:unnamed protein product [Owenia fusiformis]|uniref:Uncharacterized protein n=1 Tax=Owenia fusiformis TaxID=6347 RepID=A0A8J1UBR2_OWEFU|nr:unnamed protein product [Owenia fusiformis]